jgi:hypothetical protein
MTGSTRSHAGELLGGYRTGVAFPITLASFIVFLATGVVWLVAHTESWPGGYLPWMISLAFLLFAVASGFNVLRFMSERDQASGQLESILESTRYALQFVRVNSTKIGRDPVVTSSTTPFQFVLHFKNVSQYPIEYVLMSAKFTVGSQDADETPQAGSVLLSGTEMGHRCGTVPSTPFHQLVLSHLAEYVVRYGHPARGLQFESRHKFQLQGGADDGKYSWDWISIEGPTYEEIQPTG